MTAGSIAGAGLVLAWSQIEGLAEFYGLWTRIGLVMAIVLYEPAFTVLAKWFPAAEERRRALTALTQEVEDARAVLEVAAPAAAVIGPDVRGCVEMMSGAVWVRDRLAACRWTIEIADARTVKAIAPLACKTDRVDARVLADLVRRDLVPTVWVPPLEVAAAPEWQAIARMSDDLRLPYPRGVW